MVGRPRPRLSQYPALSSLRAGNKPPVTQDAIGRRVLRVNEAPNNLGDLRQTQQGGMPQTRGPESMTPHLLDAAREAGVNPSQAVSPDIMQRIRQLGIVPQQMAKTLRTSDPRAQAKLLLKGRI